jgi:hypothetical protein
MYRANWSSDWRTYFAANQCTDQESNFWTYFPANQEPNFATDIWTN